MNEVDLIISNGGILWSVNRPGFLFDKEAHASEQLPHDPTVNNKIDWDIANSDDLAHLERIISTGTTA